MGRRTIDNVVVILAAVAMSAAAPVLNPAPPPRVAVSAHPADTPKDAAPTEPADKGCPDGRENRSSELCAQWQAVDAARDSVNWARRAFWAGIVSLLLLLVTLWLTRRTIIETRRIGQEQTRAYLSVNAVEVAIGEDPDFGLKAPKPTLTFSNAGATPACNISYYCGASRIKVGEQEAFRCPEVPPYLLRLPNIAANTSHKVEGHIHAILPVIDEVDARLDDMTQDTPIGQMPCVVVWGAVFYDDVFQQTFRSDFAFLLDAHARPGRRALSLVQTGSVEVGKDGRPVGDDGQMRTYYPVRPRRMR
jgi:hypothetical protein